ncbi:MAG TPA: VIT1/CCC1 transporter family protein [Acidimicrobiia bacterium]|nr:VIT1/CCC1 transporter family protein [Acidimicrobiia bacterium]
MESEREIVYEPHVGASRQYWRDMVLGINDGLVSMFLLVAGVVGGGLDTRSILVTGVAGALAGAVSMGAGEYLATKSQEEVLASELKLEMTHIEHFRNREVAQLFGMLRDIGIDDDDIDAVARAFSRDDQTLLNAMKVLEFGVVDTERRSPFKAMVVSAALFLFGSLPAVIPFVFVSTAGHGLTWAAAMAAVALFSVGVIKTVVTRGNPLWAGFENLLIAGIGGVIAYVVGRAVGAAV